MSEIPEVFHMTFPTLDVRDVAEAHYKALFREGIHGQRIILGQEKLSFYDVVNWLDVEFSKFGYKVQKKRPEKLTWPNFEMSNEKSKKLLGMTYGYDLKDSILSMVYQGIESGIIEDKIMKIDISDM